jgi:hypothetical protein
MTDGIQKTDLEIKEIIEKKLEEMGLDIIANIRPETVKYLQELSPSELEDLQKAITNSRRLETFSSILQKIIVTVFGAMLAVVSFWDTIVHLKSGIMGK